MRHSNASEAVIITSNLWYGNAMAARLTAGARVLRDLFPGAPSSHEFLVDTDASSEKRHGVRDFEVYRKAICGIRMTIDERAPDHVVLLGGGCAASIAAVAYMKRRYPRLRVVWIDAHGDLNTPASSPYDRVALVGRKVLDPPESALNQTPRYSACCGRKYRRVGCILRGERGPGVRASRPRCAASRHLCQSQVRYPGRNRFRSPRRASQSRGR